MTLPCIFIIISFRRTFQLFLFSLHSACIKKDTIKFTADKRNKSTFCHRSVLRSVVTHTKHKNRKRRLLCSCVCLFVVCLFFSLSWKKRTLSLCSIQRHNDWINKNDRRLNRNHSRRFPNCILYRIKVCRAYRVCVRCASMN